MDLPENGHWTIFDKAKANRVDRTDGKSKERRSALEYLQPLQITHTFNAPLLLATFTSPVVSELAMTDGCPGMFVICYPSVNSRMTLFKEAKMENTCGDPGDALSGRKNIWFRLNSLKVCEWFLVPFSHTPVSLIPLPPFILYSNIIWKISLLPKVRPEKKSSSGFFHSSSGDW